MFAINKIANELGNISNWEVFLNEYKNQYSDKQNLKRLLFSEDLYENIKKIKTNISYEDFIYLCCFQSNSFKESLEEQINSGHLSEQYVSNTKPNEFIIKLFKNLKNIINVGNYDFIKKHITELSFIYYFTTYAINKVKLISGKLDLDSISKIDKESKVDLAIYYLVKDDKEAFKEFNEFLKNLTLLKTKVTSFIKDFNEIVIKEIESNNKALECSDILRHFKNIERCWQQKIFTYFVSDLSNLFDSLNNNELSKEMKQLFLKFAYKAKDIENIILSSETFAKNYGYFLDGLMPSDLLTKFKQKNQSFLLKLSKHNILFYKNSLEDMFYNYLINKEDYCNMLLSQLYDYSNIKF